MEGDSKNINKEIPALLNGDRAIIYEVFYNIYKKYNAKVAKYCNYLSADKRDAEELLQDTWIGFINQIKKGLMEVDVLPYLIKTAQYLSINKKKKKLKKKSPELEFIDENLIEQILENSNIYDIQEDKEIVRLSDFILEHLKDEYKELFILFWLNGLSQKEISVITGDSLAQVRKNISRSLIKIKIIVKQYEKEKNK